jgi:hypothetical protein
MINTCTMTNNLLWVMHQSYNDLSEPLKSQRNLVIIFNW